MKKPGLRAALRTRRFWAAFFLIATLATAATIFAFSAQEDLQSARVSDPIAKKVSRVARSRSERREMTRRQRRAYYRRMSVIVRKCAHIGEYTLLGLNLTGWLRLRRRKRGARTAALRAWGLGTLYACSDELHQMFVEGRACEATDVAIDSAGVLVGALAMSLLLALLARRGLRPEQRAAHSGNS